MIHHADEASLLFLSGLDLKAAASLVGSSSLFSHRGLDGASRSSALAAIFSAVQGDQREGAVLSGCDHLQGDRVQTRCDLSHRDATREGRSLCERNAAHVLLEKWTLFTSPQLKDANEDRGHLSKAPTLTWFITRRGDNTMF